MPNQGCCGQPVCSRDSRPALLRRDFRRNSAPCQVSPTDTERVAPFSASFQVEVTPHQ